jgi:hypothetical protein
LGKNSVTDNLEREELIQKLVDAGYGNIVEAFLLNENKCYTKKNRLNKSGACRVLDCKTKELEDALQACKEILQKDFEEEM